MSAVKLSDCENVQEYVWKIQRYVNNFNLWADTTSSPGSGTMPKSEHTNYLMKNVPKNDYWRFFTQLMYDKIDTLADKPEEIVTKLKAHKARQQQEVDLERIKSLALAKTQRKSEKRSSKQTRKSRKFRGSGSESNGSNLESEKHRRRNWKDTQECSRCHHVEHIAWYCPSTAPVESGAPTETAAAAAATTTSIENYWMAVTNRENPSKDSWYLDWATTSHICGDQRKFERYTKYTKKEEWEISDFVGRITGKPIRYGDVRLRLRLPG